MSVLNIPMDFFKQLDPKKQLVLLHLGLYSVPETGLCLSNLWFLEEKYDMPKPEMRAFISWCVRKGILVKNKYREGQDTRILHWGLNAYSQEVKEVVCELQKVRR